MLHNSIRGFGSGEVRYGLIGKPSPIGFSRFALPATGSQLRDSETLRDILGPILKLSPKFAIRPGIRLGPRELWTITEVNVHAVSAICKNRNYHLPGHTCGRQMDGRSS